MRYKHLWKVGVINGEIMQVNPYSLGYKCVGNIGINTSAENEEEAKKLLEIKEKPGFRSPPLAFWGKYNIGLLIVTKNIEEWAKELSRLDSNPYIKLVDPLLWINPTERDHPENLEINLLKQEKTIQQSPSADSKEQVEIDEIDRQIAKILTYSSRTSFRKIAKQLNISTKNVIQRYKNLRKNVLTDSTITLDLKKLGYSALMKIFLKSERNKMTEISNKIIQMPNMIVVCKLIGSYDLSAMAALEDLNSLISLEKEICAIKGIEQVDISVTELFPSWPGNIFAQLLE